MITFRPMNIETDAAEMARLYSYTVPEPITEATARDWWTLRTDEIRFATLACFSNSACREVAQQGVAQYKNKQQLTLSLTDLRTCLFFEAMRWKHFEKEPTKRGLEYVHALSDAIRARVAAREIK